ncbi:hypothetical protein BKA65DRAFT_523023 [Rhexocercosporidium sp. MPI-PUGE-AT-0058]|nr:hypothetical protein BKA65DRAFT_523023 [Rhexocercosporidium sp. MPI-PUGE-AT-0058]
MLAQMVFEVAIVGGGIIGVVVAMGLAKRGVTAVIYEQSRSFREIGAGVAFTANAMKRMDLIDPKIVDAVNLVAKPNGDPDNSNDYVQWLDGVHYDAESPAATEGKLLFKLYTGYKGFQGCHRAHLLDELIKVIEPGMVRFGKRVEMYNNRGAGERLQLNFQDGSTAEADASIACDGIKSRVRHIILGESNPASYPHFNRKVAYRGLIPMEKAEPVLGRCKDRNQHMHTGPAAHLLHFCDVDGAKPMTAPATREEVVDAFASWGPTVRSITEMLPDKLEKWAIFDTYDYPASTYVAGRVCLASDAAHASASHHGAGAGIGVEDALALCTLLEKLLKTPWGSTAARAKAVEEAFIIYNDVRRERIQWLVNSSRNVCDIYEWIYPETGTDWGK